MPFTTRQRIPPDPATAGLSKLTVDGGHLFVAVFGFVYTGQECALCYGWKLQLGEQEQVNPRGVPGLASSRYLIGSQGFIACCCSPDKIRLYRSRVFAVVEMQQSSLSNGPAD